MDRLEHILFLNRALLEDLPRCRAWAATFPPDPASQRTLLRGLMNLRPPLPLSADFLLWQDRLLAAEREEAGVTEGADLTSSPADPRLALWRGDITRLRVDAIVNAANSALLGCFCPCHGCIDNAIHSAAGLQLRDECSRLMRGRQEPVGRARLTGAYNLPGRYVLHTVGPRVEGPLTRRHRERLDSCYRACLALAEEHRLKSVAFCCVSTGEFHFPNREAAEIAVAAVSEFLKRATSLQRVIFNVFKPEDEALYRRLLRGPGPSGA